MTKEAIKQALEVFGGCNWHDEIVSGDWADKAQSAIKALEEALKQEQGEPVAWEYEEYRHAIHGQMEWFPEVAFVQPPNEPTLFRKIKPLYTTPQQRKPLTDEQIEEIFSITKGLDFYLNFARAIESAHGIKE